MLQRIRGIPTPWKLLALALLILTPLYVHGTFDRVLSPAGLNAHECARNGLGVTFCGHELAEYRAKIVETKRNLRISDERIHREQQEGEAKIATEQAEMRAKERRDLESKMTAEKAIFNREPEGSYASDLARDEYEAARSQLQQLDVR